MSIRMDLPMCNLKTCKYNHNAYNCFDKKSYEKCSYGYVKDDLLDAHAKIYGRDAEIKQLKAKLERSVELPCKIGSYLYEIRGLKIHANIVIGFYLKYSDLIIKYTDVKHQLYNYTRNCNEINKTLFFNKEEAEQKLREWEGENG